VFQIVKLCKGWFNQED